MEWERERAGRKRAKWWERKKSFVPDWVEETKNPLCNSLSSPLNI